ncbi:30S ribosomal protein S17 [Candidatus Woesearchaeota archaeon]|nr:30S ribosomal protein S17 [Candidatus Woesearchaeota archaeon]
MKKNEKAITASAQRKSCTDKKCPFHGSVGTKSEEYIGKIIKKDLSRSATIEWSRQHYIPKYERYEQRRSRLRVHNPDCISAEVGDVVQVMKTRPLSKTKNFVIVQKISRAK